MLKLLQINLYNKFNHFSLFTHSAFYFTKIWIKSFSSQLRAKIESPIMKISTHKRKKFKMKKHKTDKRRKANKTLRKKKLK